MRILYQIPSLYTIYAGRTIYFGYKNAFEDLGHSFRPLTADDNPEEVFAEYNPDILITSLNFFCLKYLSPQQIAKQKKKGMKVFVNTPFWTSPMSKLRINEAPSLADRKDYIDLIKTGKYGDAYYTHCEQGDQRMDGFKKGTGYPYHTILLAADKTVPYPEFSKKFEADISFIGTLLPEKRKFFKEYVFPLRQQYNLKLYGRDWNMYDKLLNIIHRAGQYYNIPYVRSFKKYKPTLKEERIVYASSIISINVHEDYQKRDIGDFNERTLKIPASGGFEIVDNVPVLHKYFVNGKDLVIAKDKTDWFEKINYYMKHPEKRLPIIKAGKEKVLKYHTYHNRVKQMIRIYATL